MCVTLHIVHALADAISTERTDIRLSPYDRF